MLALPQVSLLSQSCVHNFACALTNFRKSLVYTSIIESSTDGGLTFHYKLFRKSSVQTEQTFASFNRLIHHLIAISV
ncbi:MAG: hypothetical protein ACTS6A_00730 [Candidatus Hodgkinia cicadicola]